MEWLAIILGTAVVALFAGFVIHGRTIFVVAFRADGPTAERGRPPPGFLDGCRDIARLHKVNRGRVRCVRTGRGQALRFSRDLPERARQPIRNIWEPPPGGGPGGARARG
ncbi:DUF3634 family protein [Arhodomonas sp. AD133]|uniref:DUF3634 family protein n=1 Tax=Arhodomonas sp. AD133 TaxID=3415009 RepID=UPI003EBF950E